MKTKEELRTELIEKIKEFKFMRACEKRNESVRRSLESKCNPLGSIPGIEFR